MHAVIMAGGRGTRFWPASRYERPKQLLQVVGQKTLLQLTVDRIRPLVPAERILVVTGKDLLPEVSRQLPEIPSGNLLGEPEGRNTAPCIGWAALWIQERAGDDVMAVLPSDHFIEDDTAFLGVLEAAAAFAALGPHLVTLAIRPSRPETGFGYIELGPPAATSHDQTVYSVAGFHEKPDRETAERFLREGTHYWNSGMFLWKTSTILEAIERHLPELARGLRDMHRAILAGDLHRAEAVFLGLEPVSIDYGVMEKADSIYAFAGRMGWSDVGSWSAIYDINPKDAFGNVVEADLVEIDTRGCLVISPNKLVATIGLRDIIVVETADALLVCARERAQEVRDIVGKLKAKGKTSVL
jgi:mannose-1-phosphate guanylyltransferase